MTISNTYHGTHTGRFAAAEPGFPAKKFIESSMVDFEVLMALIQGHFPVIINYNKVHKPNAFIRCHSIEETQVVGLWFRLGEKTKYAREFPRAHAAAIWNKCTVNTVIHGRKATVHDYREVDSPAVVALKEVLIVPEPWTLKEGGTT